MEEAIPEPFEQELEGVWKQERKWRLENFDEAFVVPI